MNKELSSLNHNEPVFIYRRGGGGEGGRGERKRERGIIGILQNVMGGFGKFHFIIFRY